MTTRKSIHRSTASLSLPRAVPGGEARRRWPSSRATSPSRGIAAHARQAGEHIVTARARASSRCERPRGVDDFVSWITRDLAFVDEAAARLLPGAPLTPASDRGAHPREEKP